MSDLLDLINEATPEWHHTHVLMSNMAYLCGRNIVDHGGHIAFNPGPAIDCPDCQDLAHEHSPRYRAMQDRPSPITDQ